LAPSSSPRRSNSSCLHQPQSLKVDSNARKISNVICN
jgi:hypothetical protein